MALRPIITGEVISRENFLEGMEERLLMEADADYPGLLLALATETSLEARIKLADDLSLALLTKAMPDKQVRRFVADRLRNAETIVKHATA